MYLRHKHIVIATFAYVGGSKVVEQFDYYFLQAKLQGERKPSAVFHMQCIIDLNSCSDS